MGIEEKTTSDKSSKPSEGKTGSNNYTPAYVDRHTDMPGNTVEAYRTIERATARQAQPNVTDSSYKKE